MRSIYDKHNIYVSTPDWFKDADLTQSSQTSGTIQSTSTGTFVSSSTDFESIPIDNQTIVWENELLHVPIDNDKLIIKDGKLTISSTSTGGDDPVDGGYVTIKGDQNVEGLKTFEKGIKIGEYALSNPQTDVVYLDANLVVRGGIVMYADNGKVDVPSIYDGLPIDHETLFWVEDVDGNKVLKSKSGTIKKVSVSGDGNALSGVVLAEENTALHFSKSYTFATTGDLSRAKGELITEISKKADQTYVDETFVTFKKDEDIEGIKNFLNGIKINGHDIKQYDGYDDTVYVDANLVVRGGITMYATDAIDVPSIIDALPIASTSQKGLASFDQEFFSVDSSGKVTFIKETGGGGGNIKVVTSEPSSYDSDTLYIII